MCSWFSILKVSFLAFSTPNYSALADVPLGEGHNFAYFEFKVLHLSSPPQALFFEKIHRSLGKVEGDPVSSQEPKPDNVAPKALS